MGNGFSEKLDGWIELLYGHTESRILINGYLSKTSAILYGIHKGCPLSPTLFTCAMESLAQRLRSNRVISTVTVPEGWGQEL